MKTRIKNQKEKGVKSFSLIKDVNDVTDLQKINEGVVGVEVLMTLKQVVNEGKITNHVQTVIMAQLLMALHEQQLMNRIDHLQYLPTTELINEIKSMSNDEAKVLAEGLLSFMVEKDKFQTVSGLYTASSTPLDMMRYVMAASS